MAIIVPTLTGDAYEKTSLTLINAAAVARRHPLGYDQIGQNIFLRLMKALQTSLFVGFMAVVIIALIGVTLGAIAGFFGGWVDNALMRFVDIVLSLPTFFLILMIVAFFGNGDSRGRRHRHRLDRLDAGLPPRPGRVPASCARPTSCQAARALGASDRADHLAPHAAGRHWRRSSWRPRSASPTRSSPRRPSRSSASASARPRRASATCSRTAQEDLFRPPDPDLLPRLDARARRPRAPASSATACATPSIRASGSSS